MKWIIEDLKAAFEELKRGATWLVIAVMLAFTFLTILVADFAFKTDSMLRFLRISVTACRELTNGPIIFLFCGMIFFMLAAVTTFGEIQRYFFYRNHNRPREAQKAARHGLLWAGVATSICVGALVFFKSNCW